MNVCNFQLKIIFHHYREQASSYLVYNKKEDYFSSVGSTYSLNKKEYETKFKETAQQINTFIQENRKILDKKLLEEFKNCLDSRICKIKRKTTGILAFFYYAFNPHSKAKLKQEQDIFLNLKQTIESVLKESEHEQEHEHEHEDEMESLDFESTEVSLKEDSFGSHVQYKISEFLNKKGRGKNSRCSGDLLDIFKKNQVKINRHSSSQRSSTFLTPNSSAPLFSSPKESNIFIPPPPPPPSFNQSQVISKPLKTTLLPGEPEPLSFHRTDYKTLSKEIVELQIKEIEKYMNALKCFLEPLQSSIANYHLQQNMIAENVASLLDLKSQLKQCEENLEYLEKGENQETIICLLYKMGQGYIQVPFFPKKIQKQIIDRNSSLKEICLQKKDVLAKQIAELKEKCTQLQEIKERMSNSNNNSQERLEQLALQIKEIKDCSQNFEEELAQLSQHSFLEKGFLPSFLNLSQATEQFQLLIETIKGRLIKLEAEQKAMEENFEKLKQACLDKNGMDFDNLESILKSKSKQLDNWMHYKNTRIQWLQQKITGKNSLQPRKNTQIIPEVIKEFPELQLLYHFPHSLHMHVRREKFASGGEIEEIVNEFRARIYGQLYAHPKKE